MGVALRIPYAQPEAPTAPDTPPDVGFKGATVANATEQTGREYVPAASYQLSTLALLTRDPIVFALHALYTMLGHRIGGTDIGDAEVAALWGVSTKTIQRARRVLIDCDLVTEKRVGRRTYRRTKRPPEFIPLPAIPLRAFAAGDLTPDELIVYALVVHRRAEYGESAGCGLTRDEIAAELRIRPDTVSALVASLCTKGFLHRQGRAGTGWVLIPKYAQPCKRRISTRARYELAARRHRWKLPRPGSTTTPAPRPAVTQLPGVHPPSSQVSTQHPPEGQHSASSQQVSPKSPVELTGFNEAAAPWDDPRARWRPAPPPPLRPDNPVSRPAAADWRSYRPQQTA